MDPPRGTTIALEYLPADLLGLSPAARALLAAVPELDLGPPDPEGLAARFDAGERGALVDALERELTALEPHVAVLDAARRLREPGATCILVEALPALLGGRLAALYGALTALRLARELSGQGGPPVVAVLVNAADEHDLAAVNPAHLVNPNLDLCKLGLPGLGSGRRPYGAIRLREEEHRLGAVRAHLRQILPEGPCREEALALAVPLDGETLARAFTRAMLGLLGEHGLLVIEPAWLREDLTRVLARAVGEPQALPEGEVGAFRVEDGRRTAVRPGGDGWRYDGEPGSRTPAELAATIIDAPGAFCAGPALRPLVLDAVLPVRARVVGRPGAVEPVVQGLARRLGLPQPPRIPRLSATLIEPEARAALVALGLDLGGAFERLLRGEPDPANAGRTEHEPPAVAGELRALAARASVELIGYRARLSAVDPGLAGQIKKAAKELRAPIERLAERAERVQKNLRGGERRHLRHLRAALLPGGSPQERVLPPLPFVARHGTAWIAALLTELDARPVEHVAVHLDP